MLKEDDRVDDIYLYFYLDFYLSEKKRTDQKERMEIKKKKKVKIFIHEKEHHLKM